MVFLSSNNEKDLLHYQRLFLLHYRLFLTLSANFRVASSGPILLHYRAILLHYQLVLTLSVNLELHYQLMLHYRALLHCRA